MCTRGELDSRDLDELTAGELTASDALRLLGAALDCLGGAGGAMLQAAALGDVLAELSALSGRLAAVRAQVLARFDASRGYRADGYGSSAAWLAARGRETRRAAGAEVRRMRQHKKHPVIAAAQARGDISDSWAAQLPEWTRKLPPDWRADVDQILVNAATSGANLEDLAVIARAACEQWRSQQPDPDTDDGFADRYLKLGTTIDNAGRVTGDLTPECTAALRAVLESLGKKAGPEDDRTEPQRFHDALQLACELLIRARMVPGRAGADTRVNAVISLAELLAVDGASAIQDAWLAALLGDPGSASGSAGGPASSPARLAALAGQPGYLTGKDAEAAACDAIISPVVTRPPGPGRRGSDDRPRTGLSRRAWGHPLRVGPRRHGRPRCGGPARRGPVPGGTAGAPAWHRPPGHPARLRAGRPGLRAAARPARRAVQLQVRGLGHRIFSHDSRPHPSRHPAPCPALRMARLPQAPRLVRHPPLAP
jgi:hypothetical protein